MEKKIAVLAINILITHHLCLVPGPAHFYFSLYKDILIYKKNK